jgi:BspA type Leucine rich repeat region (6 copies)
MKIMKLLSLLLLLALPIVAQAQFTFTTNSGAITITGYTGPGGAVIIPATTNGYPVIAIGAEAFFDCTNLTSVTIPNSVTNIGYAAFRSCTSLTNITVVAGDPDYSSVNGVLFDQGQATLIIYPGGLSGSYTIPDSVTNITEGAFYDCGSLTSVTIGSSVISIGAGAFDDCTSLTSVTIPDSVTNIEDDAFYGCTNLISAYFLGNAPPDDGTVFVGDNAATTVYYLAGTTGWGPTFGSVPTALWNPQAQVPGVTAGQFGFGITGPTNATIVVEACTNLANPVWLPVVTNTLSSSGTGTFSDHQTGSYPIRYYRFSVP